MGRAESISRRQADSVHAAALPGRQRSHLSPSALSGRWVGTRWGGDPSTVGCARRGARQLSRCHSVGKRQRQAWAEDDAHPAWPSLLSATNRVLGLLVRSRRCNGPGDSGCWSFGQAKSQTRHQLLPAQQICRLYQRATGLPAKAGCGPLLAARGPLAVALSPSSCCAQSRTGCLAQAGVDPTLTWKRNRC